MEFGVPSKRRTIKEKYPNTPVITLLPFEGDNTSRKMEFNDKVYEVMGLKTDDTNEIAFSFNRSNFSDNSIINANGLNIESALNLAKNSKISNKKHYEEIKTRYEKTMEDELELTIVDSGKEFNGQKVFNLVTLESFNVASAVEEEPGSDEKVTVEDEVNEDVQGNNEVAPRPGNFNEETNEELDSRKKTTNPWEEVYEEEDDII